ncbi:SDR family NAD(P)-dependent oxidoreductase [Micromonospora sp. WMMD964]|uniref:SDR family NAD(P)-dependent oxidoreductase n=1 Tax=Micromonospora sp. WMMD964 TaxID=3016091 RepID=UPI00249AD669|nr:SDR family NAD(P)-dependent oxidoreductase [Micromonospora sp. WMMD964]WFF03745.1 SDR family NAD(P)-dependent oxidoreductase [Micromonospora sp. WMMD964]
MRTLVITGGTQGIGKALALHYLGRGERVIAVGANQIRGETLLAEADRLSAGDRCSFLPADLSSPTMTIRLAERLRTRYPSIDALVLGAFRYQTRRQETTEGIERTFALYVLSRFLLAEELRTALEQAPQPVIVNLCGTGGKAGRLHWDDLQFRRRYRPFAATMQGARANDLLGVAFTDEHPDSPIRYVLHNPLFVNTGLAEPFRQPARTAVGIMAKLFATPVDKAIRPIADRIDTPPDSALSAFRVRRAIHVAGPAFDLNAARRLTSTLRNLIIKSVEA